MNVIKIEIHPNYNSGTLNNDFSVLKLKTSVDYCSYPHIRPVCLPTDTSIKYVGDMATVTGWGTTSSGGSLSNKLREVEVKVLSNHQCRSDYTYSSSDITNQMLCAAVAGGGKDSCQGDSGGPLVTARSGETYQQIGVVSWGVGCALARAPGVYARVTSQLSWLQNIINTSGRGCPAT